MSVHRFAVRLSVLVSLVALPALAADLSIQDTNALGFNDPTPATPVSVNIGTTRGEQALIVFQTAAAMWGASLQSPVPIVINSQFAGSQTDPEFVCNATSIVLAYTVVGGYVTSPNFPNPQAGYDFALANALSGTDLTSGGNQFQVNINGDLGTSSCAFPGSWYFGLDSNMTSGQVSLFTTLMHEFGHGLGFTSLVQATTGADEQNFFSIFDFHIFDVNAGVPWTSESSAQRKQLATTPESIGFDGPAVRADIPTYLEPPPGLSTVFDGGTTQQDVTQAQFSAPFAGSGPVVAAVPLDACLDLTNPSALSGRVALIERSLPDAGLRVCTFVSKVERAVDAGATGVIVFDSLVEGLVTMSGTPNQPIPAAFIGNQAGTTLLGELGQGPVTATFGKGTHLSNTDPSGTRVLLYTPNPASPGSSIFHWNANSYPRTLNLEFAIQPDIRLNMDFTPDVMSDLGWTVVKGLGVSVVKLLDPQVSAGSQSSYVVAIINRRSSAIPSVTLDLAIPSGATVVSSVSSPAGCASGFPCTFGPMQAGDVMLVVATVQVPTNTSPTFPVTATVVPSSSNPADSLTATTTQTVATGGDLKVTVSGPNPAVAGSTATLTTTITNLGPGTAAGIALNGAVSGSAASLPLFSANSGACQSAFPCTLGSLASGTSITVTSAYTVPPGFTSGATFTATVTSTTPDPVGGNNTASFAFSTSKSGCSSTGEPATALGLVGLAIGLALRRRRGV